MLLLKNIKYISIPNGYVKSDFSVLPHQNLIAHFNDLILKFVSDFFIIKLMKFYYNNMAYLKELPRQP